jgi:short-subunit dehydrogenase
MDKTSIFDKTADARDVANDGYNGMLKNKINVISGLRVSQKILLFISTLLPTKMVLKIIHDMQKTK